MGTVDLTTPLGHPQRRGERPSRLVIAVRVAVVLLAVAALLSPLWVALRASAQLNQPPPPFYGTKAGTASSTSAMFGHHKTASLGGC